MVESDKNEKPVVRQFASDVGPDNSLLPMLIGGLVMIILGAIVIMIFI